MIEERSKYEIELRRELDNLKSISKNLGEIMDTMETYIEMINSLEKRISFLEDEYQNKIIENTLIEVGMYG